MPSTGMYSYLHAVVVVMIVCEDDRDQGHARSYGYIVITRMLDRTAVLSLRNESFTSVLDLLYELSVLVL